MHEAGSGTERSTYSHLQPDISEFSLKEIIYGPLEAQASDKDQTSKNIKYQELKVHLETVKDINVDVI